MSMKWIVNRFNRWVILGGFFVFILLCGICITGTWIISTSRPVQVVPTAFIILIPAPTITVTVPEAQFTPTLPPVTKDGITMGSFVQITGTEGEGLRLREAPGTNKALRFVAMDEEVFEVKDGPREVDGYTWWFLVAPYDENRSGWAASTYLSLVSTPVP